MLSTLPFAHSQKEVFAVEAKMSHGSNGRAQQSRSSPAIRSIAGEEENDTSRRTVAADPVLPRSKLVTRKQLYEVSRRDNNRLGLLTPMSYVGGHAVACKNKRVSHICIKEVNNAPLTNERTYQIYRYHQQYAEPGDVQRDFALMEDLLLKQKRQNRGTHTDDASLLLPPIPLFWEPIHQSFKPPRVQYVGHWKITSTQRKLFQYKGQWRCGIITAEWSHYEADTFGRIIDELAENERQQSVTMKTSSLPVRTERLESREDDEREDISRASFTDHSIPLRTGHRPEQLPVMMTLKHAENYESGDDGNGIDRKRGTCDSDDEYDFTQDDSESSDDDWYSPSLSSRKKQRTSAPPSHGMSRKSIVTPVRVNSSAQSKASCQKISNKNAHTKLVKKEKVEHHSPVSRVCDSSRKPSPGPSRSKTNTNWSTRKRDSLPKKGDSWDNPIEIDDDSDDVQLNEYGNKEGVSRKDSEVQSVAPLDSASSNSEVQPVVPLDSTSGTMTIACRNNEEMAVEEFMSLPDEDKGLEDYSARDVASLVANKGPAFRGVANRLRAADIQGVFLAEMLANGEACLDTFLKDAVGLTDALFRSSIIMTLRRIRRERCDKV